MLQWKPAQISFTVYILTNPEKWTLKPTKRQNAVKHFWLWDNQILSKCIIKLTYLFVTNLTLQILICKGETRTVKTDDTNHCIRRIKFYTSQMWLLQIDFNMFSTLLKLLIPQTHLPFLKIHLMLSKGDVQFNPVCLHATVVSLHSRPHKQRGPTPRGRRPPQQ